MTLISGIPSDLVSGSVSECTKEKQKYVEGRAWEVNTRVKKISMKNKEILGVEKKFFNSSGEAGSLRKK